MGHRPWQRRCLIAVMAVFAVSLVSAALISSFHWIRRPFPGFFIHENLTVGPYFLPEWSGPLAGLKSLDRVLSVDGETLPERGELYRVVNNAAPGTAFRYTVARDGQTLVLIIPSMTFSFNDWFLTFGIYVVTGLAFLIIGLAPYYYQASSPAALPLCSMVLAVFLWFETTFDYMTTGHLPKEIRNFALILTPSAGIHLAWLLKTGQPLWQSHRVRLVVIYGAALLLGWMNSATFFGPVEQWIGVFRVNYAFTCLGAFTFLGIVWSALRGPLPSLERSRLRVMFVGAVLGFLLPTAGTVLTSSFRWPIPYNLALVPTVFFPFSVAYALLKYSLFDLGNALKIALSRIALTALLLVAYAVVVLLVGPWAGIYENDPLVALFFSVLIVLLFNPLLRWVEGVVDRYVYRQDYDAAQVQEEVSLFLRSLATAPVLAEGFIRMVSERVGIPAAALAYRPKGSDEYVSLGTAGAAAMIAAVQSLARVKPTFYHHGVTRAEVMTNPQFREGREVLLRIFESLRCELLIPIIFERDIRGIVGFGRKRLGKEYSAEDLRLLALLTEQLALSLENGRLYEESLNAYNRAEAVNKKLLEMDRVKKQFVANICHELRTPVSTIIGYGEVLRDPSFTGDARDILDRMVANGQELASLMDNLMNFSRLEADTSYAQFEVVRLREILAGLEMMTQRLIRERPIQFGINLESPIETIESDAQKLQQILVQLLTNALKFTEKGKIELNVRFSHQGVDKFLEIAVADTGIGIKREDQDVIFEDFRQLDGSSSRQYGGTGLGLGLCKKLAAALGGRIQVSSEPGVGSVFSLLLPVKSPAVSARRMGMGEPVHELH
ncbi:MAG TPA: ATP-binding protein [Candidatus Binatia bacterium]|nr:ATP-binding protein [Candidatus Binatia bacterium]